MPDSDVNGVIILIPVLDDWESVSRLIELIDQSVQEERSVQVLIVDDGSLESPEALAKMGALRRIARVDVLVLERNLGNQRAIAIGLAYVHNQLACQAVVVMDGDGEDDPRDIDRLLDEFERSHGEAVVFAERARRSEGLLFRAGYLAFRMLHRPLTGHGVKFGNFSVLPAKYLKRLSLSSDLWNHYAASVVSSRLPIRLVPTVRASRIAGESKMNLVSLVTHGLSAMAVFGDRIAVRLLVLMSAVVVSGVLALTLVGIISGFDVGALWSDPLVGIVAALVVQLLLLLLIFVFLVLRARSENAFVPARDYALYVRELRAVR